jgi:hypothetical protein
MPHVVAYDAPVTLTAGAPCRASQRQVTATSMSPADTHRGVHLHFAPLRRTVRPMALKSTGAPCSLVGYPGVDSGADGTVVHAQRTPNGYVGGLPIGVNNRRSSTSFRGRSQLPSSRGRRSAQTGVRVRHTRAFR